MFNLLKYRTKFKVAFKDKGVTVLKSIHILFIQEIYLPCVTMLYVISK